MLRSRSPSGSPVGIRRGDVRPWRVVGGAATLRVPRRRRPTEVEMELSAQARSQSPDPGAPTATVVAAPPTHVELLGLVRDVQAAVVSSDARGSRPPSSSCDPSSSCTSPPSDEISAPCRTAWRTRCSAVSEGCSRWWPTSRQRSVRTARRRASSGLPSSPPGYAARPTWSGGRGLLPLRLGATRRCLRGDEPELGVGDVLSLSQQGEEHSAGSHLASPGASSHGGSRWCGSRSSTADGHPVASLTVGSQGPVPGSGRTGPVSGDGADDPRRDQGEHDELDDELDRTVVSGHAGGVEDQRRDQGDDAHAEVEGGHLRVWPVGAVVDAGVRRSARSEHPGGPGVGGAPAERVERGCHGHEHEGVAGEEGGLGVHGQRAPTSSSSGEPGCGVTSVKSRRSSSSSTSWWLPRWRTPW